MLTLSYALELAMANEMAMRALYFDLWKRAGRTEPELAALWEGMARDEAEHATLLRQLKDALLPEQLAATVSFSVRALDESVRDVEAFRLRLRDDGVEPDEIYRFAVAAELGEQNRVLMQIVQLCPTEVAATVYDQLKDPVSSHLRALFEHIQAHTHDAGLRRQVQELAT